jgi:hypothetical protein
LLRTGGRAAQNIGEDSMGYFRLAEGMVHIGGILAMSVAGGFFASSEKPQRI